MDSYNPLCNQYYQGQIKDLESILNEQNQIYGAQHWYPLLTEYIVNPKKLFVRIT